MHTIVGDCRRHTSEVSLGGVYSKNIFHVQHLSFFVKSMGWEVPLLSAKYTTFHGFAEILEIGNSVVLLGDSSALGRSGAEKR